MWLDDTAAVQGLTPGMLVLEGGRERRELLEMNAFLFLALPLHHLNIIILLSFFFKPKRRDETIFREITQVKGVCTSRL